MSEGGKKRREKQELLGAGLTLMEDHMKTKDRTGIPWVLFLPAKLPSAAAHFSIAFPPHSHSAVHHPFSVLM